MESGQAGSEQQAELALKLMDMNFPEEDSLVAASECSSLYTAISFLQQECLLCAGKFSAKQVL
jgi:E3 ubiquitin-protein ligase RNF31